MDKTVTERWLLAVGFSAHGLRGLTILLPPVNPGAAIAELCVAPEETGWSLSVAQGVPDDPNVPDDIIVLTSLPDRLTIGHIRRLCAALGVTLKK